MGNKKNKKAKIERRTNTSDKPLAMKIFIDSIQK